MENGAQKNELLFEGKGVITLTSHCNPSEMSTEHLCNTLP